MSFLFLLTAMFLFCCHNYEGVVVFDSVSVRVRVIVRGQAIYVSVCMRYVFVFFDYKEKNSCIHIDSNSMSKRK
jgi:hypothetical protein